MTYGLCKVENRYYFDTKLYILTSQMINLSCSIISLYQNLMDIKFHIFLSFLVFFLIIFKNNLEIDYFLDI
jgi:hypothetical protein